MAQEKYEDFKERVMRFREDFVLEETKSDITGRDHPALVEVPLFTKPFHLLFVKKDFTERVENIETYFV